ncbi:hypothetical protein BGZ98_001170 [Dissophora globulifera]|nr:hypothetical protein BGZ98_001170 [Dissophora globulifera]
MEILRDNFGKELHYIKEAIDECEFIAIDAEFSGLHTEPSKRNIGTTLEEAYEDLRRSASQFLTVQIGISTFTFDPRNGSYLAKPFNFFIFPTTFTGYSPQGRCFLTEASSLDFLAKNNFDFNKWVYRGVHYMTKAEEEQFRNQRKKQLNNDFDVIGVDPVHQSWLTENINLIAEWKSNPNALNFININTTNGYQKRLIFQEVRKKWGTELNAQSKGGHINITHGTKMSDRDLEQQKKQQQETIQREVENARGFRSVIDMLSACGKPIVGHNIVVDLAYILAQFVGPLPQTMEGYKRMIHQTFPIVIDTKYVSYTAEVLRGLAYDSTLGGLENMVGTVQFMGCPKIIPHFRHNRYLSRDLSHEAGYDAYVTGGILIRMLAYIARNETPPPPPPAPRQLSRDRNSKRSGHQPQKNSAPTDKTSSQAENRDTQPAKINNSNNNKNSNNRSVGNSQHESSDKQPEKSNTSRRNGRSNSNNNIRSPAKATPPEPASSPALPTPTPDRPTAPAKTFSYADAVHRRLTNTQPAAASITPTDTTFPAVKTAEQQQPPIRQSPEKTVLAALKDVHISKAEDGSDTRRAEDARYSDDGDRSSDDEHHRYRAYMESVEVHEKPFSMQSTSLRNYQNILHWGRSNHGCINLTSS